MKSARVQPVEDEHERPTLVPEDGATDNAMEARVLFETRVAEERRRAAQSREHEQPTRRIDAKKTLVGLPQPQPLVHRAVRIREAEIEYDERDEDDGIDERREWVQIFAITLLLSIVLAIAVPVALTTYHAAQRGLGVLLAR